MMLVPTPACVANGVGFITPHSIEEESESQGVAGPHGARSHKSGDLWVLPLSSLSSTGNLSPHAELTAQIFKQTGTRHLMSK